MTDNLVDMDTSLQLEDEALVQFVDDIKAQNTVEKQRAIWIYGTGDVLA